MNEWVISTVVTVGLILLIVAIIYLKEKQQHILIGILIGIIIIAVFAGLVNMIHEFIYELLPSLQAGN